jgi:hypothetical protein
MSYERSGLVITSHGVKSSLPAQLEATQMPQFSLQTLKVWLHGPLSVHDTTLGFPPAGTFSAINPPDGLGFVCFFPGSICAHALWDRHTMTHTNQTAVADLCAEFIWSSSLVSAARPIR